MRKPLPKTKKILKVKAPKVRAPWSWTILRTNSHPKIHTGF
jgi:hypothetical protein